MIGAIIGDIVGSRFEFNNTDDKDFEFITSECCYTDDTICSIAIADAVMNMNCDYRAALQKWCRKYPYPMGGYGERFARWIGEDNAQPNNSFGNGAAMRVSAIGWLFDREEDVLREAAASAAVSHSHEEGIKGAQAVALAIFKLRHSHKLTDVIEVAHRFYGSDFDKHIPKPFVFDVTCQGCVPLCLSFASQSNNFIEAVRRIVLYGGDTDTTGAIIGSIAEAVFEIPSPEGTKAISMLEEDMKQIVRQFCAATSKDASAFGV